MGDNVLQVVLKGKGKEGVGVLMELVGGIVLVRYCSGCSGKGIPPQGGQAGLESHHMVHVASAKPGLQR